MWSIPHSEDLVAGKYNYLQFPGRKLFPAIGMKCKSSLFCRMYHIGPWPWPASELGLLVVPVGLLDLLHCIHHKRTIICYRFLYRPSLKKKESSFSGPICQLCWLVCYQVNPIIHLNSAFINHQLVTFKKIKGPVNAL